MYLNKYLTQIERTHLSSDIVLLTKLVRVMQNCLERFEEEDLENFEGLGLAKKTLEQCDLLVKEQ